MTAPALTADEIIAALNLQPHPEGGWFRETWRAPAKEGTRASGTAIYYLLKRGERSHWHRVDATETWHYYAGAGLRLSLSEDGKTRKDAILGPDLNKGEAPQIILPPLCWQAAESLGDWTLVGCTVSPAFEFSGFEMAPPDWAPGV
ncbi:cupin [Marinicaulis flavus]|uniref:Cupin n=1 Tax=Hyphococcus luteus TaxID=2058213 RepID=A0A2S7K7F2_9PROT|nr:cupin [Marinicaulis flavus]